MPVTCCIHLNIILYDASCYVIFSIPIISCKYCHQHFVLMEASTMKLLTLTHSLLYSSVLYFSRRDLLKWFIGLQLAEYCHLFQETQDTAWLDKIDRRYTWLKRHLLEFEDKFGPMFPPGWEVSERITVEFCHITRFDSSILKHGMNAL